MTKKLFKVLHQDGMCYHDGSGMWNLPTKQEDGSWMPGDWMPPIQGELEAAENKNGYWLFNECQLIHYLGDAIFEAEYRGDDCDSWVDKVVVREARLLRPIESWNEQTARLFACDCAELVLSVFEDLRPGNLAPRHAIEVSRQFACGETTEEELSKASREAWPFGDVRVRSVIFGGVQDEATAAAEAALSAASGGLASLPMMGAANAAYAAVAWAGETFKRQMGRRLLSYLDRCLSDKTE